MERINIFKGIGVALVTPFLENGNVDVSLLFADKVAYEGKRQVLLDNNGMGLYDELYETVLNEKKYVDNNKKR